MDTTVGAEGPPATAAAATVWRVELIGTVDPAHPLVVVALEQEARHLSLIHI